MSNDYLRLGDPKYSGPEPFVYRWHALSYLNCARHAIEGHRLEHGSDPTMQQNVPIIHLICHAIEMFLKLALYKTGSDDKALKAFNLRHSLRGLADECKCRGFTFSSDVVQLIDALSPLHEKHALRYTAFTDEPVWLPFNPSEMIEISMKLITASHPSKSA